MRSIDIHAHVTPQCFWKATENGGKWHRVKRERDARVLRDRPHGPLVAGPHGSAHPQWTQGMASLTQPEKDAILWKNVERLLGS